MRTLAARAVWTEAGALPRHTVVVDATGRISDVHPSRPSDGHVLDGWLVPGLVNAHTHIERTGSLASGGEGLAAWVQASVERSGGSVGDSLAGARELHRAGTALVSDVSNTGNTGEALAAHHITGIVQHEFLGHDPGRSQTALQAIATYASSGPLPVRPTAHGPHSTAVRILTAALLVPSPHPASIHLAEHADESAFLRDGTGPFAALLARWKVDASAFEPPGCSPVQALHRLGLLGPGTLAVHCVDIDGSDAKTLALTGTPVCICPRSALHIGGRLADIGMLLEAGVRLVLGTDGRGSCPDLDVLAEFAALDAAGLSPTQALAACTHHAADVLGFPEFGRLSSGLCPGVLLLRGVRDASDLLTPPPREWLVLPGVVT